MQGGQQEFSATVKGGTPASFQWTTTASAGLLTEVGGANRTAQTTYCSTSPVANYVSSSTPARTTTVNDTVTVQAFTGAGCVPANALASSTANLTIVHSYTSIVIFGDSYSDTGNFTNLTATNFGIAYPGPQFNYAQGRFTDHTGTTPAARLYTGLLVDQLAATLPTRPAVTDSLDAGTNYAYGSATTADGTSNITITFNLSVTVKNMGQQVTDYLAPNPVITNNTLFILWGGTDELSNASNQNSAAATAAATRELALIQRLINAGATDFLVPNVLPLGTIPAYNTTTGAPAATQAAATFNQTLSSGLAALPGANTARALRLMPLDVFSIVTATIGPPPGAGFTDVSDAVQGTNNNPDTYLFWDSAHLTTAPHHLLTTAAANIIAPH